MEVCWNCLSDQPERIEWVDADARTQITRLRFCNKCGQCLQPESQTLDCVDYLLSEVAGWDWMQAPPRTRILDDYRQRRARLREMLSPTAIEAETEPTQDAHAQPPARPAAAPQPPASEPQPKETESSRANDSHPPEPRGTGAVAKPAPPPVTTVVVDRIASFMEERNIRWFHTLGGLLLLAGLVGFLKMQWSAVGGYVVSAVLLAVPAVAFTLAARLRSTLPISSRILSILGGLLMPTGLCALRIFGIVRVGPEAWNFAVFGLCAAVLGWLCLSLDEPACLYMAVLSAAVSAHALANALGLSIVFGLTCFAAAFCVLLSGRFLSVRPTLRTHLHVCGQVLAVLALASTLPKLGARETEPMIMFFFGAVFFSTAGYLVADVRALYLSALAALGTGLVGVSIYDVPTVFAGYALLAMGCVFLNGARHADEALREPSLTLGVWLTGGGLLSLFTYDLCGLLSDGFSHAPLSHVVGSLTLSLLGTAYYALTTASTRRPSAVYGAVLCAAYAWFIAGSYAAGDPCTDYLGPIMLPLAAALALCARMLARRTAERYAVPVARGAVLAASIAIGGGLVHLLQDIAGVPDEAWKAAPTLLCAAFGCAVFAPLFRGWKSNSHSAEEILALVACLLLPAGVMAAVVDLRTDAVTALVLFGCAAAWWTRSHATRLWHDAFVRATLVWSPALLVLPGTPHHIPACVAWAVPALVWSTLAVCEEQASVGLGAVAWAAIGVLTQLPELRHEIDLAQALGRACALAVLCAAWSRPAARASSQQQDILSFASWLAAAAAWDATFSTVPSTVARIYLFLPFNAALAARWLRGANCSDACGAFSVAGLCAAAFLASPDGALPIVLWVQTLGLALAALAADRILNHEQAVRAAGGAAACAIALGLALPACWAAHPLRVSFILFATSISAAFLVRPFRAWPTAPPILCHLAALLLPTAAVCGMNAIHLASCEWLVGFSLLFAMLILSAAIPEGSEWGEALRTACMIGAGAMAFVPPGTETAIVRLCPVLLWTCTCVASWSRNEAPNARADLVCGAILLQALTLPAWSAAVTLWSFAAALTLVALLSPSDVEAAAAVALGPLGVMLLGLHGAVSIHDGLLGLAVMAAAMAVADWRFHETIFERPLQAVSIGMAVAVGFLGLWQLHPTATVLFSAATLLLHGGRRRDEGFFHGAYVLLHGLLLCHVPQPRALEWVTVPCGVWMLTWGVVRRRGAWELGAAALIGVPSLLASCVDAGYGHALCAGLCGLILFLLGMACNRLLLSGSGSAMLLVDAAIQLHRVLGNVPWQIYATAAGLLLIALGLLIERKREAVLLFRTRIVNELRRPAYG